MALKKSKKRSKRKSKKAVNQPLPEVKRKRGRPRKVIIPVKRGRGRPRKEQPKRGRGRPPKEQPKKGRGRPPKKVEKRGRPRIHPIQKHKKKSRSKGVSQYSLLQHALKKYCEEKNIPLGRNFNSAASAIWKQRPVDSEMSVGYWEKHIRGYDKLVDLSSFIPGAEKEYSVSDFGTVDFWHLTTELNDSRKVRPGLYVFIEFEDDQEWNFEGNLDEVDEWYKNQGLLKHMRETYAYAQLTPIEAGKGYVKYTFKNLEAKSLSGTRPEGSTPSTAAGTEVEAASRMRIEADKEVRIKEIESQERLKSKEMKTASLERMFEKGLITKAEYFDQLGKL